jgi:hypothetical protein
MAIERRGQGRHRSARAAFVLTVASATIGATACREEEKAPVRDVDLNGSCPASRPVHGDPCEPGVDGSFPECVYSYCPFGVSAPPAVFARCGPAGKWESYDYSCCCNPPRVDTGLADVARDASEASDAPEISDAGDADRADALDDTNDVGASDTTDGD